MKIFGKRNSISTTEHFATLTAIWILASNDERPEISYAGLEHRLHPSKHTDFRQLISDRGELFRLSIPIDRLNKLKSIYRQGGHLPSWLRELPENSRNTAIEQLTADDFFRSQFRAEPNAPRSQIEIVDWGLKHIDRLRLAETEKRETRARRWSTILIPFLSVIITAAALVGTLFVQSETSANQRALKEYEVGFRPKVDGYTRLMLAISTSFEQSFATDSTPSSSEPRRNQLGSDSTRAIPESSHAGQPDNSNSDVRIVLP